MREERADVHNIIIMILLSLFLFRFVTNSIWLLDAPLGCSLGHKLRSVDDLEEVVNFLDRDQMKITGGKKRQKPSLNL